MVLFLAGGILVPQLGIEPWPSAVKAWSPHLWTAREFPRVSFSKRKIQGRKYNVGEYVLDQESDNLGPLTQL